MAASVQKLSPEKRAVTPAAAAAVSSAAGRAAGYRYSRTMAGANLVWDAAALDAFLSDPAGFMPGNAMVYSGMADAGARAAVIGYLALH